MDTSVGRNERCPCGSGRKYKRCCALKPREGGRALAPRAEVELALEQARTVFDGQDQAHVEGVLTEFSELLDRDERLRVAWFDGPAWAALVGAEADTILEELEREDDVPAFERIWNRIGRVLDTGAWRKAARGALLELVAQVGFSAPERRALALASVWIGLARGKDAWRDNLPAMVVFGAQLRHELRAFSAVRDALDHGDRQARLRAVAGSPLALAVMVRDGARRHQDGFAVLEGLQPPPLLTGPECLGAAAGLCLGAVGGSSPDEVKAAQDTEILWRLAPAAERVDGLLAELRAQDDGRADWIRGLETFAIQPDEALLALGRNPRCVEHLPPEEASLVGSALGSLPHAGPALTAYGAWLLAAERKEDAQTVAELLAELRDAWPDRPAVKLGRRK